MLDPLWHDGRVSIRHTCGGRARALCGFGSSAIQSAGSGLGAPQLAHSNRPTSSPAQVLDRYFGNVCELDLIFNFHKVSM